MQIQPNTSRYTRKATRQRREKRQTGLQVEPRERVIHSAQEGRDMR